MYLHSHWKLNTCLYEGFFTKNSSYYHSLKYSLFLRNHPVYGGEKTEEGVVTEGINSSGLIQLIQVDK